MAKRRTLLAAGGLLALAACEFPGEPLPPPDPAPITPAPPPPPPPQAKLDPATQTYYARLQQGLLTQGLLRQDGGGPDTPFNSRQLARNFIQIALFDEYKTEADALIPEATESRLRRWEEPVRFSVDFGAGVPADQREADRAFVSRYAAKLERLTGHPVSVAPAAANFNILILDEESRQNAAPRLRRLAPGISDSLIREVTNMPRSTLCILVAFTDQPGKSTYSRAIAVIRAEHPTLLRNGCIEEELAQGMGLANDSPQARPSIFNDDEEFGRLTTHDELLLQMLYDPRLKPGMTVAEAEPLARIIAREVMGEGES
ncbi:DUF2927 domain-containing protein [Aestuariibius sp. 2305UL40-4]|uniref:DUF2927 domain-containing protein n=1 Tax=Aestuariibius violaceus TaxID=3234132 RepID=UPI00345EC003